MRLHRGKHYVLRGKPERNDCERKKQTYHKKHRQECFFVAEAEKTAEITHNHPEGIKGAIAIAVAIFRMRTAKEKSSVIFEHVAKEFYGDDIFSNLPPKGVFDVTCQGCVPLALYLASLASDFEDAIRLAVAYGGDSDTVGAIVGSLAEAQYPVAEDMQQVAINYLPTEMQEVYNQFEMKRRCKTL